MGGGVTDVACCEFAVCRTGRQGLGQGYVT